MATFPNRVIGAMKLQAATFEKVEHDRTATTQAALVVLAASLASGFGVFRLLGLTGMVRQTIMALIAWAIGSFVIWAIGTKVLPGKNTQADVGELLRVLGFAQAPGLFAVLGIVPLLGGLVYLVIVLWTIAATVVAVRQALDYDDTFKAVIVVVLAWVASLIVSMLLALIGLAPRVYSI